MQNLFWLDLGILYYNVRLSTNGPDKVWKVWSESEYDRFGCVPVCSSQVQSCASQSNKARHLLKPVFRIHSVLISIRIRMQRSHFTTDPHGSGSETLLETPWITNNLTVSFLDSVWNDAWNRYLECAVLLWEPIRRAAWLTKLSHGAGHRHPVLQTPMHEWICSLSNKGGRYKQGFGSGSVFAELLCEIWIRILNTYSDLRVQKML